MHDDTQASLLFLSNNLKEEDIHNLAGQDHHSIQVQEPFVEIKTKQSNKDTQVSKTNVSSNMGFKTNENML